MADTVAELFRRSLRHLESEVPASYRHLVSALGPLVVEVAVDDGDNDVFTLRADHAGLTVRDGPAASAGARVSTSRATILDVLDAELSLVEAVESGRLEVRGSLDDVLRAHDTLIAYAHASVRAPSVPALLSALRTDARGGVR
ncbi:MAG TPA: SCP2 sterol-binding domain-containing protein [Pseudonocardia sp.]|jgi:hypothetical protein|nr:SCP2 sterol-binding domain-containing protein [Pseudonocardia sp.]